MAKSATVTLNDTASGTLQISSSPTDGEFVEVILAPRATEQLRSTWTVKAADLIEAIKACTYRNEED